MIRDHATSLASGILFGAGLAISGMINPARVRAFLDVAGSWDPTLAFVMGGAILPMAIAWWMTRSRSAPFAADTFHLPPTSPIDAPLVLGAALFGLGWGFVGLCPGPAIAALALHPVAAVVFLVAMAAGIGVHCFALSPRRPA